jgi:hypothetical protein
MSTQRADVVTAHHLPIGLFDEPLGDVAPNHAQRADNDHLCCIWLTRPTARPVLTPYVLDGFPFLECSLDCNKILVLGIFGMLFDGSASPGKPSAPSGANRVFRKTSVSASVNS